MTIYSTETSVALYELVCWSCYVPFAMPAKMYEGIKAKGGSLYCPKGCHLGLGKSENEKLRDELTREKQAREQEQTSHRNSIKWRDDEIKAKKGQLTKLKNRIGNGVCPCCTRSFQNLQRHMAHKHPTFKQEKA
jgi:hypothetical protein